MDTQFILDKKRPQAVLSPPALNPNTAGAAAAPAKARELLRFPGEDGGKSLSEMAKRDLDATLQLLAERAQYITGASGAAIALRDGESMICCASSGESAPELGAHLQIDSGLSAESVRTRKILHCDDAETDPRVNRESCQAFGITSVAVMPLVRDDEVCGVFELLAGRPHAFEERDFVALQRLSEMIQTALDHAGEARRREQESAAASDAAERKTPSAGSGTSYTATDSGAANTATMAEEAAAMPDNQDAPERFIPGAQPQHRSPVETPQTETEAALPLRPTTTTRLANVRTCEDCGFPISEGRRLCLDCEAAAPSPAPAAEADAFFGQESDSNPSWIRSHSYLVAAAVIVVATIAVVVWRF